MEGMDDLLQETTLLTPIVLSDLNLNNRIVLAPLTRARCHDDGVPKEVNVEYYVQRASAGLLISEGVIISESGMGWPWAARIYNDEHVEGWKKVTQAVHDVEGKIFCQLWHMGRISHSSFHGLQPIGPSPIVASGQGTVGKDFAFHPYEVPREASIADIKVMVEEWRNAAQCAKEAGFDGVEIHAANGYCIDLFLSTKTNHRNDEYGGSFQKKYRFLKEIIEAVSTVFPIGRIGVRLSPNGSWCDMGHSDNHETFSFVIAELEKFHLGYLHIIDGLAFGFHNNCKQFTLFDVRKAGYTGLLIGNGGYSKDRADGAIGSGCCDMIAFGRPYMSNPDLVERFANNWPLAEEAEMKDWWSAPYLDCSVGYTDYPTYTPPNSPVEKSKRTTIMN